MQLNFELSTKMTSKMTSMYFFIYKLLKWAFYIFVPIFLVSLVTVIIMATNSPKEIKILSKPSNSQLKAGDEMIIQIPGGAKMEFCWIPSAELDVKLANRKNNAGDESHNFTEYNKGFWIGKYEVTIKQWHSVMWNLSLGSKHPVTNVSWYDCQNYVDRLNQFNNTILFQLPTIKQWIHACKAGTDTIFYWGHDLNNTIIGNYEWYLHNSDKKTHRLGLKKSNNWGLHDMSGNVSEWCQDYYFSNKKSERAVCGGTFYDSADYCCSGRCFGIKPVSSSMAIGFRVLVK